MKRKLLLLTFATISLLTLSGCTYLGLFNAATTIGWDSKDTTANYTVGVKGLDIRVYEWVSEDNPNVRIVYVAGDRSAGVTSYLIEANER